MSEKQTIPCEVCGKPITFLSTKRCNNCWEVESRLGEYLKSRAGQEFARSKMPLLDDWVDGHPDAWDYEAVLRENEVTIEWSDSVVDCDGNVTKLECEWLHGWALCWKHGTMHIGNTSETVARKAGAMFVCLWLRGISASFADKLMDGFVVFLERQENPPSGTMTTVTNRMNCQPDWLHAHIAFADEDKLLRGLGLKDGDKVGVVFHKIETR